MSSINGILTILKAWNGLCSPDEVFSLGVMCSGNIQPFEKKSSVLSTEDDALRVIVSGLFSCVRAL